MQCSLRPPLLQSHCKSALQDRARQETLQTCAAKVHCINAPLQSLHTWKGPLARRVPRVRQAPSGKQRWLHRLEALLRREEPFDAFAALRCLPLCNVVMPLLALPCTFALGVSFTVALLRCLRICSIVVSLQCCQLVCSPGQRPPRGLGEAVARDRSLVWPRRGAIEGHSITAACSPAGAQSGAAHSQPQRK